MKKVLTICLLIILVISISGCSKNDNKVVLQIKESSWSGWDRDYKPKEVTRKYNIVLNKKYYTKSGSLQFKVIKINEDNIIIKTTWPFSDNSKGINLNSNKTKFKVYYNKVLKLVTPTTDAGDIYYLKLIK